MGRISTPPLATAAATIAICSGVTCELVLADRHAPDVDEAAQRAEQVAVAVLAAGQPLVGRVVERRLGVEAEARHVLAIVSLAERLGHLRPDGVDRVNVSAVVRSMSPKLWPSSFCSGTPEMTLPLPLTVESGVYLPLSIAAIAVTTLNVEPGG